MGTVRGIEGATATIELIDGREITVERNDEFATTQNQAPIVGDKFVVGRFEFGEGKIWQIYDHYRLAALLGIFAIFILVLILIGGWRGLSALAGLAVSIGGTIFGIVPALAAGYPPLAVALVGGAGIAGAAIFIAHGFNFRSLLAFIATMLTLGLATLSAVFFTNFASLFGTGSEESFYLTSALFGNLDLRGLLLAGILLGALGVLDDITVAEVTTADELIRANPNLSRKEIFKRTLRIGREHIASMVNTLALAYAGVALPLILLFSVDANQPLWALINSEFAAEEIVRTLVGSLALVLAAPLASGLGAFFLKRK
ncbi:MAG: YibE/F family protein [Candidatus Peribacteraceae bacterium]|nr:YibE/F family protein [Candidatus Peribacteraceae bacterium]